MKKIIFTTPIFGYPPCCGPELRIFNSLIALSKISETHVLFQKRYENLDDTYLNRKYGKIFNSKEFLFPNNLPYIFWRITTLIPRRFLKVWQKVVYSIQAREILKYAKKNNIDVIWFGYGNISYELINNVRKINPKIKIVCDTDSVWSRFVLRRIRYEKNPKIRLTIKEEGQKKIIEEKKLIQLSDIVTAVSDVDKKYYEKITSNKDKIRIFPNVINPVDYKKVAKVQDIPKGNYIYLSGSFGYKSPMEDAAVWFLEKIFPEVKRYIPDIKAVIVGSSADVVLSQYENKKNIYIKGWVKSTIPYLKNAKVSIVPLRYESGTRFKILEAGICSIPVVSTTLGAEGIDIIDGENIKIADSPKKFADSIIEIIENPKLAITQAKNLYELVKKNYSVESLAKEGKAILNLFN